MNLSPPPQPSPVKGEGEVALYIHWPFCAQKCPYCDFNSHVRSGVDSVAWGRAYRNELEFYRHLTGPRWVTSVFFGGGTPSLMSPDLVGQVIADIHDLWGLNQDVEVTLEANPTSSEADKFCAFKQNGINRLSIGVQSLSDADLKFLGRAHDVAQARATLDMAAAIFDRFSFDLIYARPGQTLESWAAELRDALPLVRGHLSLYQLTIEPQTPFFTAHARGEFAVPGEGVAADLYTLTDEIMTAAGLPPYEISNYAACGHESRHNLAYWHYRDYVGVGPGAHGRLTLNGVKVATRGHRAPEIWLDQVAARGNGAHPFTLVKLADRGIEAVMMGLRLTSGLDLSKLESETGMPWDQTLHAGHLNHLIQNGDLTRTDDTITPTLAGRLRLNPVISYLLGS